MKVPPWTCSQIASAAPVGLALASGAAIRPSAAAPAIATLSRFIGSPPFVRPRGPLLVRMGANLLERPCAAQWSARREDRFSASVIGTSRLAVSFCGAARGRTVLLREHSERRHRPLDAMRQERGGSQLAPCDAGQDGLEAVSGLADVVGSEIHAPKARRLLGRWRCPRGVVSRRRPEPGGVGGAPRSRGGGGAI